MIGWNSVWLGPRRFACFTIYRARTRGFFFCTWLPFVLLVSKEIEKQEEKNDELTHSIQELRLSRKSVREEIFEDVFTKLDKYVVYFIYIP